jgi:non-ribosomal peptide synthetase component F
MGTTANDYLARLLQEAGDPITAPNPVAHVRALLARWQQQDNTPTAAPAPNDGSLTPSEALFRAWEQEDARLTEVERQTNDELWRQFQQEMNAERTAIGMRPIF